MLQCCGMRYEQLLMTAKSLDNFILTGSNAVDKSQIHHSGAGRIARLRMLPMSLWESQESTGEVSLKELFNNPDYDIDGKMSKMTVEDLIFAASRGGWPASLLARTPKAQLLVAKNYVQTICSDDISGIDGRKRDAKLTSMILRRMPEMFRHWLRKSLFWMM